ncbi:major facilitator superfamily domain-containing protein [Aspergillus stella-maris]|uniref:major facilitator superfamily domain-containing protein n=1 Tax=Aspergillus stella-maris TaxID=1810926 RepID=UPI003CCE1C5B
MSSEQAKTEAGAGIELGQHDSDRITTTSPSPDWTTEEERRARRKIDLTILPLLTLGMITFQLDRMNLASALTNNFTSDISVSQNTINLGNQLMFLGIILLEIPSNMLLQRVGASKWIPAQVFIFGLIATMQVFLKDGAGFLASRMLLGLAEAGYIPGAIYTLSTWYTSAEIGRRTAVLFFGMFGGNAVSPLLGAGILRLHGRGGLRGWQFIFLIEGVMTMVVASLLLLVLPTSPQRPRPLFFKGLVRFSERERYILSSRQGKVVNQAQDQNESTSPKRGIPLSTVKKTILNYRRWPHFLATACIFSTWSPLTTYTSSIIMSLGFTRIQANALSAIGASLTLPLVFLFATISDKTKRRGLTVIAATSCYLVVLIVARCVLGSKPGPDKWKRFGLWTVVNAFAVGYHPVHNVWVQVNCGNWEERSIAISMWVMSAISGLLAGTQIFRGEDSPTYLTGLVIMIAIVSSGLALAIIQEIIYLFLNARLRRRGEKTMYTA